LVAEKFVTFVKLSERDDRFAAELPAFATAIKEIFSNKELTGYLNSLEQMRVLASPGSRAETSDIGDEGTSDYLIAEPLAEVASILQFGRIRKLLGNWR